MKKQFFHVLALVLALTMCFAMALPVLAENEVPTYEANTSGKVTFDKDLIMPKDATVPDVKFTFTLAAHDTKGKNGESLEGKVFEGWEIHQGIFTPLKDTVSTDKTTPVATAGAYSVTFNASHATTKGVEESGNKITEDPTMKYATESFSIDFDQIKYPEPGIYRYTVTEDVPEAAKEENDFTVKGIKYNKKTFYVDVYVENDTNGNPKIADVIVSEEDNLDGSDVNPDGTITPDPEKPYPDPSDKIPAGGDDNNEEEGEGDTPTDPVPPKEPKEDDPNKTEPADPTKPNKGLSKADFINNYTPLSLTVDKTVSGSQASRTDYFTFTLTIDLSGVDKVGDTLSDGAYTIVHTDTTKNNEHIVVREGKTGEIEVTLKHGESFKILLPYGATYTIKESAAAGYSTAVTNSTSDAEAIAKWTQYGWSVADGTETDVPEEPNLEEDYEGNEQDEEYLKAKAKYDEYTSASNLKSAIKGENKISGTLTDANATVSYVNFKDGITPTGILLAIAPFVVLMVVAVVGGVIVLKKKKED